MVAVSVLMPVWNGAKFLSQSLNSVLAQTFTDFELLILDDGSTDDTPNILSAYMIQDRHVHVITRENRGLVASLNELLDHARGEFVARMDADDISLPNRFLRQVQFLRDNPDVVCVGGNVEAIDDEGRFLTTFEYAADDEEIEERNLVGIASICHPAAMMRREALVRVNGYDADFFPAEDLDLWLRLGEIGKLANLSEAILRYRFHASSISEQAGQRQCELAYAACERAWRRRGIQRQFEGSASRPAPSRGSRHEHLLKCGWWAWKSEQRRTAASYALRAIAAFPQRRGGWFLLACALVKPLKPMLDAMRGRANTYGPTE
jgi:glycosyltransferase involved in cell wall biosynthesis